LRRRRAGHKKGTQQQQEEDGYGRTHSKFFGVHLEFLHSFLHIFLLLVPRSAWNEDRDAPASPMQRGALRPAFPRRAREREKIISQIKGDGAQDSLSSHLAGSVTVVEKNYFIVITDKFISQWMFFNDAYG